MVFRLQLSDWRARGSRPASVISTDLMRAESPMSRKKVPPSGGVTPGSVKKRTAPNPPLQLYSTPNHNRTPSDPMFTPGQLPPSTPASSTTSASSSIQGSAPHKRNLSMDVGGSGGPSLLDEITSTLGRSSVQRPKCPPPPKPPVNGEFLVFDSPRGSSRSRSPASKSPFKGL